MALQTLKAALPAVLTIATMCGSWVAMSELIQGLQDGWEKPWAVTWVIHSGYALCLIPWALLRWKRTGVLCSASCGRRGGNKSGLPRDEAMGVSMQAPLEGTAKVMPVPYRQMLILSGLLQILSAFNGYTWYLSLNNTLASANNAIYQSAAALVFVISYFYMGEAVTLPKIIAVLVSIAGVVLISFAPSASSGDSDVHQTAGGYAWCLASTLGYAVYEVIYGRFTELRVTGCRDIVRRDFVAAHALAARAAEAGEEGDAMRRGSDDASASAHERLLPLPTSSHDAVKAKGVQSDDRGAGLAIRAAPVPVLPSPAASAVASSVTATAAFASSSSSASSSASTAVLTPAARYDADDLSVSVSTPGPGSSYTPVAGIGMGEGAGVDDALLHRRLAGGTGSGHGEGLTPAHASVDNGPDTGKGVHGARPPSPIEQAEVSAWFLGTMGLFCAATLWPVSLLFHYTGVERFELPSGEKGRMLALSAALDALYNVALLFGISITSPLWMAVGTTSVVPVTIVADYLIHRTTVSGQGWGGIVLIMLGFVILQVRLPRRWTACLLMGKCAQGR